MSAQLDDLKAKIRSDVLPGIFSNPNGIAGYGRPAPAPSPAPGEPIEPDPMTALADLMEAAPVAHLAAVLGDIVAKLADADPKKIAKPPTRLERLTGRAVEVRVRYQVARETLEELIATAHGRAQSVRDAVQTLDDLAAEHAAEVTSLKAHLEAGREYLAQNPDAGKPRPGELDFENSRERFARKLANMATLLASHEMSLTQMALTRAQAVDMLDRFDQTANVLVPVWRQHTLALASTKNLDPAIVANATRAHESLMRALSDNLAELG